MKLVEDVEQDVFREMEMRRMGSPVVVDCKKVFKETANVVYLGIGKGD